MTSYDGTTFTWEGRNLVSLSKGGSRYQYNGIRAGKTANRTATANHQK